MQNAWLSAEVDSLLSGCAQNVDVLLAEFLDDVYSLLCHVASGVSVNAPFAIVVTASLSLTWMS